MFDLDRLLYKSEATRLPVHQRAAVPGHVHERGHATPGTYRRVSDSSTARVN